MAKPTLCHPCRLPGSERIDAKARRRNDRRGAQSRLDRLMKLSLIQMNSISDKAINIASAIALIERAFAEDRPDWICLPECFDFLGADRKAKWLAAESFPGGAAYSAMQQLAAKHRIYIHAGSILEKPASGERIHNTTVVFDRN